jgi:catechol 2,3-dioxygenase-like lactoylglutathione lyase family enzyme
VNEADQTLTIDHCVIAVSDWERSNRFYRDVLRAEVIPRGPGYVYRFGEQFLSVHGPGMDVQAMSKDFVARVPVQPGNSDLCFVWPDTIEKAIAHLERNGPRVENGPFEATGPLGRHGHHVYFRDPDGSLIELVSYT